jgi:hypothetical protein
VFNACWHGAGVAEQEKRILKGPRQYSLWGVGACGAVEENIPFLCTIDAQYITLVPECDTHCSGTFNFYDVVSRNYLLPIPTIPLSLVLDTGAPMFLTRQPMSYC